MKTRTLWLSLFLAVLPATALPQPADGYLIAIRLDPSVDLNRLEAQQLPVYHRFGQTLIAGLPGEKIEQFSASRIPYTILDTHPWSENYYLLTSRKVDLRSIAPRGATVLLTDEGGALVKAHSMMTSSLTGLRMNAPRCGGHRSYSETRRSSGGPPYRPVRTQSSQHLSLTSMPTASAVCPGSAGLRHRYCLAPNRDSVALWIQQQFVSIGYTDVQLDSFLYSGTWQKNVIATLPGTTKADQIILIGAHHDSYSSGSPTVIAPGADDNASGTAAVLEIARILQKTGYRPKSTIKFATFAAEERGLLGSRAHAQRLRAAGARISLMVNHDMISYSSTSPSLSSVDINYYTGYEDVREVAAEMVARFCTLTPRSGREKQLGLGQLFLLVERVPGSLFC